MSVGYPDYARLSLEGGYTLYSATGNVTNNVQLFRGYVGNWPYINLSTSCGSTTDFTQIAMQYFSDSTFSTMVGFRNAVRFGGQFALTQYANMSDWLIFFLNTKSNNPYPFNDLSLFATVGQGTPIIMPSLDVPVFEKAKIFTASEADQDVPGHINPGTMQLNFFTAATDWNLTIRHYDYGSGGYQADWQTSQATSPAAFVMDWPQGDYPIRLDVTNNDAASRNFQYSLMTKS